MRKYSALFKCTHGVRFAHPRHKQKARATLMGRARCKRSELLRLPRLRLVCIIGLWAWWGFCCGLGIEIVRVVLCSLSVCWLGVGCSLLPVSCRPSCVWSFYSVVCGLLGMPAFFWFAPTPVAPVQCLLRCLCDVYAQASPLRSEERPPSRQYTTPRRSLDLLCVSGEGRRTNSP
jgi:hypothetical protein